ncbi:serine hydrolase domain-containing protein [Bacillus pseudomycoides]|uniref:serine hydrolase domain-containing protein n=1 Tax=Bacillus pseudomycoides TaxID=64104 RepID=UPI000BEB5F42|nr:serine hydrolase domain-containing protein [Bacillus pseudomycoides]MED4653692.1 serine hydrolase [Bacillus pseudomycoides]PEE02864.1 serine hydrolase [Bacillus pseudomycoides]PEM69656.1 serine hydrolase [Bacillus pseudomycoides]PHC82948.1 serine hydrolase [Bacillus pseudomycoides]
MNKKKILYHYLSISFLILVFLIPFSQISFAESEQTKGQRIQQIDQFIKEQQELSQIPGISVVIVEKGKTVYQKGFGYADLKTKKPVNEDTLFELASTSKAFTGLAILQLEKEGLLKRTDDITKFLPWLKLTYNDKPVNITLNHLLYQTSGIPSTTISDIPISTENDALEATVKTLQHTKLDHKPGSSFEYATINYDILGLVIEKVTKKPYEVYMKQNILNQIGMKNSLVGYLQGQSNEMATGYKLRFMRSYAYTQPIYRGNTPAGYVISNTNDLAKWMNLQLGTETNDSIDPQLISDSHIPDKTVKPVANNSYYASGWVVLQKDKKIVFHNGENPNFSSFIIMQPDEQTGVAVLANMKSTFTTSIGQGVIDLWNGKNISGTQQIDSFQKVDKIATIIFIVTACLSILFIILTIRLIRRLLQKRRNWTLLNKKKFILFLINICVVAGGLLFFLKLPKILLGAPWSFITVWAPVTVTLTMYSFITVIILYSIYTTLMFFTKKKMNRFIS